MTLKHQKHLLNLLLRMLKAYRKEPKDYILDSIEALLKDTLDNL